MSSRINILKLFTFFMFALTLHGCGYANQGNDTATAAETKQQAAADEAQTEDARQTEPAGEDNTQKTAVAAADTGQTPQYHVECDDSGSNCRVGMETYIGWRIYRSQCTQCHGQDATGTTFAPSLLERLNQRVDYPRFVDVVTNGYRGQMGVMPAWKDNKSVMEHIPNLYMYLEARADGVLDASRPEKLE